MLDKIYGINPVLELLTHKPEILKNIVIYAGSTSKRIKKILKLAEEKSVSVSYTNIPIEGENKNEKVMAHIHPYRYTILKDFLEEVKNKKPAVVVILDQITDQGNFGAIIRTCNFFGVDAIIIPMKRSAEVIPKTVITSQGALFFTKIIRVGNLRKAIDTLKENDFWVVGTVEGGKEDFSFAEKGLRLGICIGSEGTGLRELTKKRCDFLMGIPSKGVIGSLNASVFTGVMLWEVTKRIY